MANTWSTAFRFGLVKKAMVTRRPWYLSAFGAGILWKLLFSRSSDKYISTSPASTQGHLLFSRV